MTKKELWAQRIAAWQASGQSVRAFCEGKEYAAQSLYVRIREFRREGAVEVPAPRRGRQGFARVEVKRDARDVTTTVTPPEMASRRKA